MVRWNEVHYSPHHGKMIATANRLIRCTNHKYKVKIWVLKSYVMYVNLNLWKNLQ